MTSNAFPRAIRPGPSSRTNKTRKTIMLTGSSSLEELNQSKTFCPQKGNPYRGMVLEPPKGIPLLQLYLCRKACSSLLRSLDVRSCTRGSKRCSRRLLIVEVGGCGVLLLWVRLVEYCVAPAEMRSISGTSVTITLQCYCHY